MPRRDAAAQMRRLGILGGTFNPIHLAHLRSAEELAEDLGLDHVLFIPSASPPHKRSAQVAPAHHRMAMVRLALRGNPRLRASTIEVDRGGHSYSVDTLRMLREKWGHRPEIFFIVGIDAFREVQMWKEYDEIFSLAHVVVISRPPDEARPRRSLLPVAVRRQFCYLPKHEGFINRTGKKIIFRRVTALDISASGIRARLARGRSIRYLLPLPVQRYIEKHHLYVG